MIARRWILLVVLVLVILIPLGACAARRGSDGMQIRVMTMNLEDVRHEDAIKPGHHRLERLAAVIQKLRPDVLLLNEIETFQGVGDGSGGLSTADAFIENYLRVSQGDDLEPIGFTSFTPLSNTGVHSGFDLDRSGITVSEVPEKSEIQTNEQRAYGGDSFGFGGFPGQYGMALLVGDGHRIELDGVRTFQRFLWKDLPGAIAPTNPDGTPYYAPQEWDEFRLASKTFADVPVLIGGELVLHALISHPTPPAFDGAAMRNKHRNRDEIGLIRAYIDDDEALYDDTGGGGGLVEGESFVVLGDLNADPIDGSSLGDPIGFLLSSDRMGADPAPDSEIAVEGLDPTDTAAFRLRVDYVLPSSGLVVIGSGVWRSGWDEEGGFGSDHFPVWVDLVVPWE